MEDAIEEIVGEINDESDEQEENFYKKTGPSSYLFESKTSLNDFCKILDKDVRTFDKVRGESQSLGGLLLELFAGFPKIGDKTQFGEFTFTVVALDEKRKKIRKVEVYLKQVVK